MPRNVPSYWYQRHPILARRYWRKWKKDNRVKIRRRHQSKTYREKHREQIYKYQAKWRKKHPIKVARIKRHCDRKHLEQRNEAMRRYRKAHPDYVERQKLLFREYRAKHGRKLRKMRKDWGMKLKKEVFGHYSPKMVCVRCGFKDLRALSIDHIRGGGAKHAREIGASGTCMYSWLKENDYPKGFQVLCMNCQWIKRNENREYRRGDMD